MVRRTLIALVLVAGALAVAPSAHAESKVTVTNEDGKAMADKTYTTTVTVKGRGFQSIKGGHGGIYVFFGTVDSGWRPSQGGQTGKDYLYVPDSESKENQGFQKFVAFPGSDTTSSANGGTIAADGSWSTSMTIPGAKFNAVNRDGQATAVDCLKVTCGIITIGAHGVVNAHNETFTPIAFGDLYAGSPPPATPSATPQTPTAPQTQGIVPLTPGAPSGSPTAVVDRATAVVGRVLSFTATGFAPGEQVVASFDDGLAAVGPLSAGPSGDIAGALQLPADTTAGTHVLRLTGAASASTTSVNFAVAASPTSATDSDEGEDLMPFVFLGLSLVVLVAVATTGFVRLRRRRTTVKELGHAV